MFNSAVMLWGEISCQSVPGVKGLILPLWCFFIQGNDYLKLIFQLKEKFYYANLITTQTIARL